MHTQMFNKSRGFQSHKIQFKMLGFLLLVILESSYAQLSMPVNYLPKEYFLSDGRRDPRHIIDPYYSSGGGQGELSGAGPLTTTTYHLNPSASSNPIGSFGGPHHSQQHHHHPIINSEFGNKILQPNQGQGTNLHAINEKSSTGTSSSGTRHRRRLSKSKKPKNYRPPKEFIIYSLPEQSFWALNHPDLALDPQSQKLDDEDRSNNEDDEDDDEEDDSSRHDRGNGNANTGNNPTEQPSATEKSLPTSSVPLTSNDKADSNSSDGGDQLNTSPSSSATVTLAEKKVRLGQCMKYCMDAIL